MKLIEKVLMKVRVRDIRVEGLEVAEELAAEDLGYEMIYDFSFIAPLKIKARLERVNQTVLADIGVYSRFSSLCSRCLEPIENNWEKHFNFDYAIDPTVEFIEINDDIRQELFLNLPTKLLCQEHCKGLCLACGINLNKEQCNCSKES